jgi:Ni,Fe-hydrogenase III large subunit
MSGTASLGINDLASAATPDRDGFVRLQVTQAEWIGLARGCADGLQDLCSLWIDGDLARMALLGSDRSSRSIVSVRLDSGDYPSVGCFHAPAIRLERAMRDLHHVVPLGLPDTRPWLDHGKWPGSEKTADVAGHSAPKTYTFLPVDGDGLHQIPVGPVHAGIIEPGHFRFTANGETVVRLEQRLGYVHKGVEAQCVGKGVAEAARIVARVSGDSTVAYSFAFARAIEAATGDEVPPRAAILRGVMAELERISHHVNDFGAICNDASVVALNAHCTLLREQILQACGSAFGHRLMMDRIVPGGVAADLTDQGATALRRVLDSGERGIGQAIRIYDGMPSIQDRTVTTGHVSKELASRFGAGGFVGRASGRDFDCRRDVSYSPYETVKFKVPTRIDGDVNARALIRVHEIGESISIVRQLLDQLRPGPIHAAVNVASEGEGVALAEAFRGDVFVALRLNQDGTISRCHVRDASWFQWPLLEAAIEGNIVADFPLCNKSFNCSYSGHDI